MIQSIHEPSTYNYIGSSKNMPVRIGLHKSRCFDETNKCKLYQTMCENGGWEAFQLIELEHHNMTDQDAREYEQQLIDMIQPNMNSYKAWTGLTHQEYNKQYRQDNKEQFKERLKEYYVVNKERFKQYRQDNKELSQEKHNCECGGKYTTEHKSHHLKSEKHKLYIADQHYKKQLFKRFRTTIKV
tara:strand:+ start:168 stop:722 length:555 start_codon:yes stop_codon:yes gene_type:complete